VPGERPPTCRSVDRPLRTAASRPTSSSTAASTSPSSPPTHCSPNVAGRELLTGDYDAYASIAARAGAGLLLETPTWRANRDWGARLGHTTTDLARANADAVDLLRSLRRRYAAELGLGDVLVVGVVGPRGDGYRSDGAPRPAEAADHHRAQVAVFAEAGVEVVTAYTLTTAGEAIGIAQSCREQGLPVAISFTVEVDGRLPDGTTLTETITEVDDREAPDYYLVNCATRITCSRG
jgi:homocysteine S-methyltransferase